MTGEKWIEQELHDILVNVGENYEHGYGEASIEKSASDILSLCQENIYLCPTCHNYGIYLSRYESGSRGEPILVHECVRCRDKWHQSATSTCDSRQVESFCRATVSEVCHGGMTFGEGVSK